MFTLVDASISIAAYLFEREKLWVLLWIIPQRFCYRWIMYVVLFKSYKRAIKGELQTWGVLKRTGNVKEIEHNISILFCLKFAKSIFVLII